jgi:hypothetical protein
MIHITRYVSPRFLHNLLARLSLTLGVDYLRPVRRSSILLITVVMIALIALTINANTWFAKTTIPVEPIAIAAQTQKAQANPVQVELFTLHPHGFEPAQITRPKGRFVLAVDNRSGVGEVQLQLHRVVGNDKQEKVVEKRTSRKQLDWGQLIDLRPGRYALSEVGHEEWVSFITITQD